jgi:hypothetical protein
MLWVWNLEWLKYDKGYRHTSVDILKSFKRQEYYYLFRSFESAFHVILKHNKRFREVFVYLVLGVYMDKEGIAEIKDQ